MNTADLNQNDKRVWSKARAILAGGIVLGVGAAVTLAAWSDDEIAVGDFSSGQFGIYGKVANGAFAEHPSDGTSASLSFGGTEDLTPGSTVYDTFTVKLIDNSTRQAEVTVSETKSTPGGATDLSQFLTSEARILDAATTCGASAFTSGSAIDLDDHAFTLSNVADEEKICIRVAVDDDQDLPANARGIITWTFEASSGELVTP